jgi:hypothetical protein
MTIEVTSDPVIHSLETRLPWLQDKNLEIHLKQVAKHDGQSTRDDAKDFYGREIILFRKDFVCKGEEC